MHADYMPGGLDDPGESQYESTLHKIMSARGERAILLNVFGMRERLARGLSRSEQLTLIRVAAWRWAEVSTRRLAGNPDAESVISCAQALSVIYRKFPDFTRLDFERMAVDAFHRLPPKAFKRRRTAYGRRR